MAHGGARRAGGLHAALAAILLLFAAASADHLASAAGAAASGASAITASCAPSDGLHYICGPVASEDLARIPHSRWLIASGLNVGRPAHLFLIDTRRKSAAVLFPLGKPHLEMDAEFASSCTGPPDLARLSTDGLALRQGSGGVHRLYAANHGDRMAIEVFRVDTRGAGSPRLRWIGCLPMPPHTLPNAVAALPDGGVLAISSYDPDDTSAWSRMARGEPTGQIFEWRPGRGFQALPRGATSGGNGLEASTDGRLIYASAWSAREIIVLSPSDGTRRVIPLTFMPDNIHRLENGALLVGGQATTVEAIRSCAGPQCPQPWVIARVDPASGWVRILAQGPGTAAINYACGALLIERTLYISERGAARIAYLELAEHVNDNFRP